MHVTEGITISSRYLVPEATHYTASDTGNVWVLDVPAEIASCPDGYEYPDHLLTDYVLEISPSGRISVLCCRMIQGRQGPRLFESRPYYSIPFLRDLVVLGAQDIPGIQRNDLLKPDHKERSSRVYGV